MRYKCNIRSSKETSVSRVALFMFVMMVFSQSLSLVHDLSHHEHEESEFCVVLNAIGSNEIIVTPQSSPRLFFHRQTKGISVHYLRVDDKYFYNSHRSRAPPLLSFA